MGRKALPPRIEPNEDGVYYVLWSDGKRTQRQSLRTKDQETALARFAGWIESDKEESRRQAERNGLPKVKTCWDHYFKFCERNVSAPSTIKTYGKNILPYFGEMYVNEITDDDVDAYIKGRRSGRIGVSKEPATDGTIRSELTKLRACMNFMVKKVTPIELRIEKKHVPYFAMPEPSPARERVVVDDSQDEVLRAAASPPGSRMSRLERYLWLGFETGARDMAMRQLKWEQVDFKTGRINYLPKGARQNKVKRRPIVPISDFLMPVLKRMYDERTTEYVLDKPTCLRRPFIKFMVKNGFHNVTPHTMRHSFATQLIQQGVSIEAVAALLGDTVKTVMETYMHLQPTFLKAAMEIRNAQRKPLQAVAQSDAQKTQIVSINNLQKGELRKANKRFST